jgi:hypothetical protein
MYKKSKFLLNGSSKYVLPTPVAARSKAYVCGRSLAGIADSNTAGGMDVCLLWMLCVVQVEASAKGRFLLQRSPIECGVCVCAAFGVIRLNSNPLHLQRVGRRDQTKIFFYTHATFLLSLSLPVSVTAEKAVVWHEWTAISWIVTSWTVISWTVISWTVANHRAVVFLIRCSSLRSSTSYYDRRCKS